MDRQEKLERVKVVRKRDASKRALENRKGFPESVEDFNIRNEGIFGDVQYFQRKVRLQV